MKRIWFLIYDKLIFFAPVLIVIAMAAFLVYCTYLANFTITAAVVAEEGTGTEAASAGLVNALTFILPAIIGGFGIALLFKYRKRITLKFFFGGALCFAGAFITFFFGDSILFLIQTRFYGLFVLNFDNYNIILFDVAPFISYNGFYYIMIVCCVIVSFLTAYTISSRKFTIKSKNYALLFQSALMGAFLSVILPTFTVVILLIGLSIYDIYSVRRGPIKDIVKYTLEDEDKYFNQNAHQKNINSRIEPKFSNNYFRSIFSIKISFDTLSDNHAHHNSTSQINNQPPNKEHIRTSSDQPQQVTLQSMHPHQQQYQRRNPPNTPQTLQPPQTPYPKQTPQHPIHQKHQEFQQGSSNQPYLVQQTNNEEPRHNDTDSEHLKNIKAIDQNTIHGKIYEKSDNLSNDIDDTDTILTSMTYSSQDWDIGIGDLVFYSMLASQPLTPYFIFNHGTYLLETYGLWIFWLICLCTIIGILIGFIITIRLLERNSMLPGLPLSIALGLTGFLGSTFIFLFI